MTRRVYLGLRTVLTTLCCVASVMGATHASAQAKEVVLQPGKATTIAGGWTKVSDSTAAGGVRLSMPEKNKKKLEVAMVSPGDYFEMTFTAQAGTAYRLWMRSKAVNDHYNNDSVFVQFSGAVTASGGAAFRIGTTAATVYTLEDCSGCGMSGWGWNDNYYGSAEGSLIYFAKSGQQTIRVQNREDGLSIDQIVLSPALYKGAAPGARRNDATVLDPATGKEAGASAGSGSGVPGVPPPAGDGGGGSTSGSSSGTPKEIVLQPGKTASTYGGWSKVSNSTSAGGAHVSIPDKNKKKLEVAMASPGDYFEMTFQAQAGTPYRLWMRSKAVDNHYNNDSVFVQFSGAVTAAGGAAFRIGTTASTTYTLEDCSGCGVKGWGWNDNYYGTAEGTLVYFATTGTQTIRVQNREDGLSIDQIVLSPAMYRSSAPGDRHNDDTILDPATGKPVATPPSSGSTGTTIKFLHYNLHHGVGTDGKYDIERIANVIAKANPDVVSLNEVEKFTGWGNEDQPKRYEQMLEAKTGKAWYAVWAQEYGDWDKNGKGNLLLSRFPFTSTARHEISWERTLPLGQVTVNGRTITFATTHFDPDSGSRRLEQAKQTAAWFAGFAENRVLAGDTNGQPTSAEMNHIKETYVDGWQDAKSKGIAHSPSDNPNGYTRNSRIDFIFTSKKASHLVLKRFEVIETRDSKGVMPSDHRPIMATYDVR